ncbi:hypothetical protein, partial [Dubosiella newyorkensis]|uniref:hypothetical protein n=1 Tax=Dubosiella newyorkensis TaxID=1862672 RepID=UPI00272AB842
MLPDPVAPSRVVKAGVHDRMCVAGIVMDRTTQYTGLPFERLDRALGQLLFKEPLQLVEAANQMHPDVRF